LSEEPAGLDVEAHVRSVAASLGVADFVYLPSIVDKGNAIREVSDGLLVCRRGSAVLQVKSRDRVAAASDNVESATRWLRREYKAAVRQGEGTRRTIRSRWASGDPVLAIAVRALAYPNRRAEFAIELGDPATWPTVIVLDHPQADGIELPINGYVFVVSLDDWRNLNLHIRSVNGLLRYIHRALLAEDGDSIRLGAERERFSKIAAADTASAAERDIAVPWFSLDGSHEMRGVALYRELMERIWGGAATGPELTAPDCRHILNFLDDAPIAMQARVGEWALAKRRQLSASRRRQSGLVVLGDRPLVYVCDLEENEPRRDAWVAELGALTAVRLAEWAEQRRTETSAVCIGVREKREGVEYTHIYATDELGRLIPRDLRATIEERYGIPDLTERRQR